MADTIQGQTLPALPPQHSAVIYLFPASRRVRPVEETRSVLPADLAATAAESIPLWVFAGHEGKAVSKAVSVLERARITTLGQLAAMTQSRLGEIDFIGPTTVARLGDLLQRHGLGFQPEEDGR